MYMLPVIGSLYVTFPFRWLRLTGARSVVISFLLCCFMRHAHRHYNVLLLCFPSWGVWSGCSQQQDCWRWGCSYGQLALAGKSAAFRQPFLWRLSDKQGLGADRRSLLPRVSEKKWIQPKINAPIFSKCELVGGIWLDEVSFRALRPAPQQVLHPAMWFIAFTCCSKLFSGTPDARWEQWIRQ